MTATRQCFCVVGRHVSTPNEGDFDPATGDGICAFCDDLMPRTSMVLPEVFRVHASRKDGFTRRSTFAHKSGHNGIAVDPIYDGQILHCLTLLGIQDPTPSQLNRLGTFLATTRSRLQNNNWITDGAVHSLIDDLGIAQPSYETLKQVRVNIRKLFWRRFRVRKAFESPTFRHRAEHCSLCTLTEAVINDNVLTENDTTKDSNVDNRPAPPEGPTLFEDALTRFIDSRAPIGLQLGYSERLAAVIDFFDGPASSDDPLTEINEIGNMEMLSALGGDTPPCMRVHQSIDAYEQRTAQLQ